MGVLKSCKPRPEVLKGDLDDAIFAADFGNLIEGKAPTVYGDVGTFFRNTHPAKQLCHVIQSVFGRLVDKREGGATIRLSTGFGGGKTHTLMALWHLAKHIGDPAMGTELLPAAGRPKKVTVAAVDAAKAGVPLFASHGRIRVKSLWGEIFFQLGGDAALKRLGKADDPEASPNEKQIESAFPAGPVLILLDELVIYMAKLSERGAGNLLGFLNALTSVVGRRKQTVLIMTDPGAQVAYAAQAEALGHRLSEQAITSAAKRLDDIADRKASDFDPIGDESARVIVRRLFDRIDSTAAQSASATYHALYERVIQESPGTLPADAASGNYAKRIVECYPFHPRLLDTATDRLGALQDFQKSRGVLRLFARILRDVFETKDDPDLITAGEIDWSSSRIRADLLDRLNRTEFRAAISADVQTHAGELDGGVERGVHRRVASALMLESLPLSPSSGLEPADLTLAVLRPDEAGPEPAEALERLTGVCWHTYPTGSGRGCQFRFQPNVLKQIEERLGDISVEDARSRVLAEAQGYFQGITFKPAAWPTSARQVPKTAALQLALCEDEKIAKLVVMYEDDSNPAAPRPREFQNAVFAVTATPAALNEAIKRAQRLMAAEAIDKENRGESGRLIREQTRKIMPELRKRFEIQARRAFDCVVLPGGLVKSVEEKYQGSDEDILKKPRGQSGLKRLLEDKGLIYQAGEALDAPRFMKDVLRGAVPVADQPQVYTAQAVHERFLGAPGLRLIPDGSVVRQTLLKATREGRLAVRLADGRAYDANGCVEGPDGRRRRIPGPLTTLALDDSVRVTPIDSPQARAWLKEDTIKKKDDGDGNNEKKPPPPPPPEPPARVTATTWEKVLECAADRPLLELHLTAGTPADAAGLPALAPPLGAETLRVSVTVDGTVKDGGSMSYVANDIRLNHPAKPLQIAQMIFNSLADGATYEVYLILAFGQAGRTGLEAQLRQLSEDAPERVSVRAAFDKPVKVKS